MTETVERLKQLGWSDELIERFVAAPSVPEIVDSIDVELSAKSHDTATVILDSTDVLLGSGTFLPGPDRAPSKR